MADTDLARIRLVLLRELETINHYEELARAAESEEIRAFFLHLAEEEKEHVAEATYLLRKLDPGQEAHFQKDFSTAHFEGEAPHPVKPNGGLQDLRLPADPTKIVSALPASPSPSARPFTVGALRRRDHGQTLGSSRRNQDG